MAELNVGLRELKTHLSEYMRQVKSGRTIVSAFVEAGILSFIAIIILLAAVLKRMDDVIRTLAPLVLAARVGRLCQLAHRQQPAAQCAAAALPLRHDPPLRQCRRPP